MNSSIEILQQEAIALVQQLIAVPSFSKEEWQTAGILSRYIAEKGFASTRVGHNVFLTNKHFDQEKPTLLLNSHHDTVKPNVQYTRDPFAATIEEGKLYGLGSNDAGGCLVALLAAFMHYYEREGLKYNLIYAATAEEEISGAGGIEAVLPFLPPIDSAIVGEPTMLQMAVAERGLLVIDAVATGKAGHAARDEGENAIYKAMKDIGWITSYRFEKDSPLLGPTKMNVTVIETENRAHNVVPAQCRYVIDVRINELFTFEEVLGIIRTNTQSELTPRSTRLRSSMIALEHPLVKAGLSLGKNYYGSPTTSDKALMPFPALKIGPGDSARSHSADEFIYVQEINEGIEFYIELLNKVL